MESDSKRPLSNLRLSTITGAITATLFAIGGFILIASGGGGVSGMRWGFGLFLILPFATGFAASMAIRPKETVLLGTAVSVAFTLFGLIVMKLEGLVCCLMALPLILPGIFLGALIGYLIRKYHDRGSTQMLGILIAALLVIGADWVEKNSIALPYYESVDSSILLKAAPADVWEEIKAVETMDVPKPLLLKIGLPVPRRCTISHEGVGAKRICYFNNGSIEERVTEWRPPHLMKLEIVKSDLPGRHWLTFAGAKYELYKEGEYTLVKRTTSFLSKLRPRWYWRIFEGIGFQAEHKYLFDELAWSLKK